MKLPEANPPPAASYQVMSVLTKLWTYAGASLDFKALVPLALGIVANEREAAGLVSRQQTTRCHNCLKVLLVYIYIYQTVWRLLVDLSLMCGCLRVFRCTQPPECDGAPSVQVGGKGVGDRRKIENQSNST